MLNEEFFRAASKVGCPWNFYSVFVVEALLACSLSNPIRVVCSLIKPLMIGVHLALKTFQIKTKKRVALPTPAVCFDSAMFTHPVFTTTLYHQHGGLL